MTTYPRMDEISGPCRSESAPVARQPEPPERPDASRILRRTRHGPAVVSKHLAVLEAANLVTLVRRGREKLHYLNPAPINEIGERWITPYERERVDTLADLKRALEGTAWTSLVRLHDLHPDHARAPLAGAHRPGLHPALLVERHVRHGLGDGLNDDLAHVRREDRRSPAGRARVPSPPAARLYVALFPHEFADRLGLTEDARERIAAEPRSKVTFEIEPLGDP